MNDANPRPAASAKGIVNQPCTHPLGAKGCGEAGSIAAPAAIVNAVLDALAPLGITNVAMPLTPERVWRVIEAARS